MPLQARSRERVERLLDAAAHVFADAGYDGATTEAIAARAGTSIGSLYQFFPNKLALFNAIALRYIDRVRALFESLVVHAPDSLDARRGGADTALDMLDRAIDAFAALNDSDTAFRAILLNWRIAAEMMIANDEVNRELARRAEEVIGELTPALAVERRAQIATMIIEVVSAILIVRARRADAVGDALVGETKTMLRRYLAPILEREAREPAKKRAAKRRT